MTFAMNDERQAAPPVDAYTLLAFSCNLFTSDHGFGMILNKKTTTSFMEKIPVVRGCLSLNGGLLSRCAHFNPAKRTRKDACKVPSYGHKYLLPALPKPTDRGQQYKDGI